MQRARVVSLVAAVCLAAGACTSHPVGPARTDASYEGKARTTAASARSSVETVLLVVTAYADGDAIGTYAGMVVSDEEEALSGLQGTFGSIQPPSARADEVREELDGLLTDALGHVTDVRVAVRRGDGDAAAALVPDLREDAHRLAELAEVPG